jgi:hypothetical protein
MGAATLSSPLFKRAPAEAAPVASTSAAKKRGRVGAKV